MSSSVLGNSPSSFVTALTVSFDGFIFNDMQVSDIISHAKGQIAILDPYKVREQGADSAFPVVHFNFQVWNSTRTESANIGQPDVPL